MSETFVREQRRFRRFELKLPVEVIRTGAHRLSRPGETRNLSSGGVLFTVQSQMEVGQPIEYFITLPTGSGSDADVRLRCKGKVVRLERPNGDLAPTSVAATLERYEFIRQSPRDLVTPPV
ncbi:MAG: PilZ domain-containing protein [Acidobacteria bacterium]|nr:PilZ domain-containing protein [Acidobacteriota bacterium]